MSDEEREEGAAAGAGSRAWSAPPERLRAIDDAAWRHFSTKGYDSVGLAQIASDVGLARSTVQGYVGSKRRLYQRCLDRALAELEHALDAAAASGADPEARLRQTLGAFLDFAAEHQDAWGLIERHIFAGAGPFAEEGARLRAQLVPKLEGLLLGRAARSSGGAVASAVLGSLHALATWNDERAAEPRSAVIDQLFAIVWAGVSAHLRPAD